MDGIFKGELECKRGEHRFIWVYQEIKRVNNASNEIPQAVALYKPIENEAIVNRDSLRVVCPICGIANFLEQNRIHYL